MTITKGVHCPLPLMIADDLLYCFEENGPINVSTYPERGSMNAGTDRGPIDDLVREEEFTQLIKGANQCLLREKHF